MQPLNDAEEENKREIPGAGGERGGVSGSRGRNWTGWKACPGSFFCGTVVPASQLPTRVTMVGDTGRLQQWPWRVIYRVPGF
jgi:hypothetical protein